MGHKVNVDNPPGAGIIYNIYLSIDPSNRVVIVRITHRWTIFATFARKAAEYYYYFPWTCCVNHIFFHPRPLPVRYYFFSRHDHHTTDATRKKGTAHDRVPHTRAAFVVQVQSHFSAAADSAIQRVQMGRRPGLRVSLSQSDFFFCSAKCDYRRTIRSFFREYL